jgi:23S rRNA (cytidine1920-2'-O)/16S rRNA (cytidine1409-2'-O)-methyltransferase
MRADQLLVDRGLASSRAQAQRLIASGVRWRAAAGAHEPWRSVAKNGDDLPLQAQVELLDLAEARYVSRGGLKLEAALKTTSIDVQGKHCLDVGQSTGGFTDCLLQQGAAQVTGVDVGHGQLHPKLRADPRVICVEKTNARSLVATNLIAVCALPERAAAVFDLVVGDLSFISLTLVLPALLPLLAPDGDLLMLVKPQFELQPGQVGKGGIVRDTALYAVVEQRLRNCCLQLGLNVLGWFDSPVPGGDGNREFFIHARQQTKQSP